jgi:hypothetical protein
MWFVSEEDEQRFAHALLASLLAHVLVLGYVRGVEPLRKAGVGGALNVSFRSTAATGQILAQARLPTPVAATAALVQAQVTAPRLATPKPQPQPAPTVERKGSPESAAAALHSAESFASRVRASSAKGPGVVKVLLIIGADGHPQGIYWTALPALTTEQFEQLEAIIRRQIYASSTGARLTQEIDVFTLLGIGRQASPAAPAVSEALPAQ